MARSRRSTPAVQTPRSATVVKVEVFTLHCPFCDHELRGPVKREAWSDVPSVLICPTCLSTVSVPAQPEGGHMGVWNRDNTFDLFQRQLYALQSEMIRSLEFTDGKHKQFHSKYVLEVRIKGRAYTAVIEGYSHDYWLHRVDRHPLAKQIDLVICYRHTSCVRQKVLELCSPTGREYDIFETPSWFDLEARGGRAWAQVFTGALLAGYGAAYTELEKIREESPAAYYRYLERKAQLAAHHWGRPVAV